MLMEMIQNREKETEDEKEQENGANGVEPERSGQEDEESGEVVACEYKPSLLTPHRFGCFTGEASAIETGKFHTDYVDLSRIW